MKLWSPLLLENANFDPSGDHVGDLLLPRALKRGFRLEVYSVYFVYSVFATIPDSSLKRVRKFEDYSSAGSIHTFFVSRQTICLV